MENNFKMVYQKKITAKVFLYYLSQKCFKFKLAFQIDLFKAKQSPNFNILFSLQ